MSTDGALTWSTPKVISGEAPGLCFFGNFFDPSLSPSACNNDQGSDPVVLPNGDVVVTFNNGNTGPGNPNAQQLSVVCHPTGSSSAGTANLNCGTPTKVGDDITAGEPQCDFGRGPEECVPGPYIRTNDYARITKENTQNNHLYAVWQDYRNGEHDIQMSMSTDGGLTWHETGTVKPDSGLDHYMPATDQSPVKSDRNGVSYDRSERAPNENTTPAGGFAPCASAAASNTGSSTDCQPAVGATNSDYVLAGGTADNTPYAFKVVSPVFPPPDGIQSGFNGDYSGLTVNRGEEAHPFWADTRNVDPYSPANGVLHDEDIFSDQVQLPNGKANTGPGRIGKNEKPSSVEFGRAVPLGATLLVCAAWTSGAPRSSSRGRRSAPARSRSARWSPARTARCSRGVGTGCSTRLHRLGRSSGRASRTRRSTRSSSSEATGATSTARCGRRWSRAPSASARHGFRRSGASSLRPPMSTAARRG
jgi:hypothetical protein